ncbi:hypothetical protein FXO37_09502 [Capsicum annuum]|nr:hypothetical protein FXO37_09502 [Capsicum annuum]
MLRRVTALAGISAGVCERVASDFLVVLFQENDVPPTIKGSKPEDVIAPDVKNALQAPAFPAANDITVPSPPPLKLQVADHISMTNLQKDLQNLFEYNMMLREKLIAAQSMLHSLANKGSTLAADSEVADFALFGVAVYNTFLAQHVLNAMLQGAEVLSSVLRLTHIMDSDAL